MQKMAQCFILIVKEKTIQNKMTILLFENKNKGKGFHKGKLLIFL